MIVRAFFRERIQGPGFSFDSAAVLGHERTYPAQQICQEMNQRPYGIEIVVTEGKSVTVPWSSVRYTNDITTTKEKKS